MAPSTEIKSCSIKSNDQGQKEIRTLMEVNSLRLEIPLLRR